MKIQSPARVYVVIPCYNEEEALPITAKTMGAFREFGYKGIMSVEYAHGEMPEYLVGEFINLTYKSAKHVWEG